MRTHIGLYEGYVRNFNELLDATEQLRQRGDADLPLLRDGLARRLAFEWNGIRLHELFFDSLGGPDSQREPPRDGHLSEAMNRDFGGFHAWQDDVRAMGTTRGIGWVLTVWDPLDDMLSNVWVESHHLGVPAGAVLVLAFDLWEHAWFRDYEPAERSRYLEAVLRNIDYEVAEARLRSRRPWDSPESTRRTEGIGAHGTEN